LLWEKSVKSEQRDWIPLEVPLDSYAGQTFTLRLSSDPGQNPIHDWGLWRSPQVRLTSLGKHFVRAPEVPKPKPSNTDLFEDFPKSTAGDLLLTADAKGDWRPPEGEAAVCLENFSYFSFQASLDPQVNPRAVKVAIDSEERSEFLVPLLNDGKVHRYAFDLKLLKPGQRGKLKGIRAALLNEGETSNQGNISGLRLIRAHTSTACR